MKIVDSSRRQVVMAVLLALAVLGAVIRYWADKPSLAHDIGTLLLVLWLPAVGNLVAFVIRKLPRRARPPNPFGPGTPFTRHLRAEVTPVTGTVPGLDPLQQNCTVLLGNEGFTARSGLPLAQWLAGGKVQAMDFELLRPVAGSHRLGPGAAFHVVVGVVAVAKGRVTESYFAAIPAGMIGG